MTSTAWHVLRATAAVTGIAVLGTGAAGAAFAEEAPGQKCGGLQAASVDGFNTDSVAPVNTLSNDVTAAIVGQHGGTTAASPTDPASAGQLQGFTFEMPPMQFGTAGEQQFDQTGTSPMMTPMMEHALPAVIGGQQVSTADQAPQQSFGQGNGMPEPVNEPANDAAGPAGDSVMPGAAGVFGTLSDSTTNDDSTSNHEFSL
jgi:hypothetical protein